MRLLFGQYIKNLRTNNQMTLTQLAAKLELDSANLSKIENGKREFDEKRLYNLSVIFELDFEILKVEYFGDKFAKKMIEFNCLPETLNVAREKIIYINSLNAKQAKIEFEQ